MAQCIDKFKNIDEINYNIILKNLKGFIEFRSEPFYVCGNPWIIVLRKGKLQNATLQSGVKSDFLGVFLYSQNEDRPDNYAIVASFTTKIISSKFNGKAHQDESPTLVFDSKCNYSGVANVIPWNVLVDPEQGYVYKDTCKIIVTVKSSPLQTAENDELVTLIPIKKCCDASTKFSFLLEVNRLHGFVNVCSPEFTLNNMSWRLLVCKTKNPDGRDEDILQVKLQSSSMIFRSEAKRIMATLACKMVSSERGAVQVRAKMENKVFKFGKIEHALDIISWNELLNPQKGFSENDSFILEVRMEIPETGEQWANQAENNDNDAGKIVCPICFETLAGKSVSAIRCMHVYCTACIHRSLRNHPRCPKCNKFAAINQLRRVYLSME